MPAQAASELRLFHDFLGRRLDVSEHSSVEESVKAFREYQRDLVRLRHDLSSALTESEQGLSEPLDVEDIITRGRERAAADGIKDECPA